ncbi:MAG TPA: glutaredoxin 2 [Enterobacteriaceae bacterium]|nr:glutaredoxin 2 [Enterobacteriaceae bacterium]
MKLYVYDHCPFCTRARMAFSLKNEPVELSIMMEGDIETPTRMIGKKIAPILEKRDGTYMAESLNIVRYVDEIGVPAFSSQISAEVDSWLKEIWPVASKLFIPRFTKADFAELSTSYAREAYRQREEKAFGNLTELMAQTPELVNEIMPKLHTLVPLIQQRQVIDINDIVIWPVLRCLSIVKSLVFPPGVRNYASRIEAKTGIPLLYDRAI